LMSDIVAYDTRNVSYKEFRQTLLITFLSVLELGRLGFVSLFQNEVFSDLHIQAKSEIASSGLQRVQEFDSTENVGLSEKLFVSLADDEPTEKNTSPEKDEELVPSSGQLGFSMPDSDLILDEEIEVSVSAATDEEIFEAELELSEDEDVMIAADNESVPVEEPNIDSNHHPVDSGHDFEPEQSV
jgi:hypothetical protein